MFLEFWSGYAGDLLHRPNYYPAGCRADGKPWSGRLGGSKAYAFNVIQAITGSKFGME